MSVKTWEILGKYGKDDLAILYLANYKGKIVEFVESVQPPVPRDEKWVIIISTLYGCPMKCMMCDAGEYYIGPVSKEGMLSQIDHIISARFPDGNIPISKLKLQFARMGEPALNNHVLDLLRELPKKYHAPGLLPCVSTVAPKNSLRFFEELLEIKDTIYPRGMFQLQFSIHTTDISLRKKLISPNIWSFEEIAQFGEKWYKPGDRKITLNFAVARDSIIDPQIIRDVFDPARFFIKMTPINPTNKAIQNDLGSQLNRENYRNFQLADDFRSLGYETLISFGEWEENQIGSNCGQFATEFRNGKLQIKENYTCNQYDLTE